VGDTGFIVLMGLLVILKFLYLGVLILVSECECEGYWIVKFDTPFPFSFPK